MKTLACILVLVVNVLTVADCADAGVSDAAPSAQELKAQPAAGSGGTCVQNMLCVQGSHFDRVQCKCVPDVCISQVGGPCGGFTQNPCTCAVSLACEPNHIPDIHLQAQVLSRGVRHLPLYGGQRYQGLQLSQPQAWLCLVRAVRRRLRLRGQRSVSGMRPDPLSRRPGLRPERMQVWLAAGPPRTVAARCLNFARSVRMAARPVRIGPASRTSVR